MLSNYLDIVLYILALKKREKLIECVIGKSILYTVHIPSCDYFTTLPKMELLVLLYTLAKDCAFTLQSLMLKTF